MKRILLTVALLMCLSGQAWGAEWYVRSETGTYGAADGTTYATAFDGWADITWGVGGGAGVKAGDTLWVCGTLSNEYCRVGVSGTAGSRVWISGASVYPGIIDGASSKAYSIGADSVQYVTFQDLTVRGGTAGNLMLSGTTYITIKNVTSDDGVIGISYAGTVPVCNTVIEDCSISNASSMGVWMRRATDFLITNTTVANNGTAGVGSSAIKVDYGSTGVTVQYCTITSPIGATDSAGINVTDTTGYPVSAIVRYNVVYDSSGYGLKFTGTKDIGSSVTFYQNVVYDSYIGGIHGEFGDSWWFNNTFHGQTSANMHLYSTDGTRRTTLKNNVFSGGSFGVWMTSLNTALTSDYNLFYGQTSAVGRYDALDKTLAAWRVSTVGDLNSKNEDPLLLAPGSTSPLGYQLRWGSPAYNAGTNVGLTSDYSSLPVPQQTTPDIGAFEYHYQLYNVNSKKVRPK